ncbi:MAG TPA: DUF2332 domain-containing protein [Rhizomicrobium sp.]|nr:DUF2332 domain-containing protein [Rhizomicrobium sp.]
MPEESSDNSVSRLSRIYADFADLEAAARSPLYAEICRGVAGDMALLVKLADLPLEKQQPNLLLAAMKYLFGTALDWPQFRKRAEAHWDAVLVVIMARRTQTNEPARCATLLPLLALLPQPLALLEVGASAGLCLLPDKYAYDFGGRVTGPTRGEDAAPLFHCAVNDATPVPRKNIDVVWRAGLDLNPLDVRAESDVRWLHALVWPGEGERGRLLDEALAVARRDPPRVVKGDLRHDLAALAAEATRDATLVVFHSAVLAYVPDMADRLAFAESVKQLGAQWVSNESANVFRAADMLARPWGRFLLSLNNIPQAYADGHGAALDWIAGLV